MLSKYTQALCPCVSCPRPEQTAGLPGHGPGPSSPAGRAPGGGPPTFEEDDLVVAGALIHGVHAVQARRQTPPEPVHLRGPQGHQVPIPCQSPEVLSWGDREGVGLQNAPPPRVCTEGATLPLVSHSLGA